MDYWKLNSITCQDAYPVPRIKAILEFFAGATYFTTVDLTSSYWQVEIEEQDMENSFSASIEGILSSV